MFLLRTICFFHFGFNFHPFLSHLVESSLIDLMFTSSQFILWIGVFLASSSIFGLLIIISCQALRFKVILSSLKVFFCCNLVGSEGQIVSFFKDDIRFNFFVVIFLMMTVCRLFQNLFDFEMQVDALSKFLFIFEGLNSFCFSSSSRLESEPLDESSLF